MEPTLRSGDTLVTRPGSGRVVAGDLVVVAASGRRYVKRVAGRGGDVAELEAGRLRINGSWVDSPPTSPGATTARWVVPAGQLFLVGDNSGRSSDSRSWEHPFVPMADVEGVVVARVARRRRVRRAWI